MNLLMLYIKLILLKNKKNYLYVILSIIAAYVLIAVLMVYIDNVLILSSDFFYPDFRYLYHSIRAVFIIAGVSYVSNQYYSVMKSGLRDYLILRQIGATRYNIRILILVQILCLILITTPVGLLSGFSITDMVLKVISSYSLNTDSSEMINTTQTFFIIVGAASCFIISVGIYLDREIKKMPCSNLLTEFTSMGQEMKEAF